MKVIVVIFNMFYEKVKDNYSGINKIILLFQFMSLFYMCLRASGISCRGPNACGDCGICSWSATLSVEHCETNYLENIFMPDPPKCSLRDYCNSPNPPCLHGGNCESTYGSYFCLCTNQFYGQNCQLSKESNKEYTSELILAYLPFDNVLKNKSILVAINNFGGGTFRLMFNNGAGSIKNYKKTDFKRGLVRELCDKLFNYHRTCMKISNVKVSYFLIMTTVYPYVTEGKNLIEQKRKEGKGFDVIGQFIESEVVLYNYDESYFPQKFTHILDHRLLEKDTCIPRVQITNCGPNDLDFILTRKVSRTITSITKPNKNCQTKKDITLEWKIYNYRGGNFDNEANLVKQKSKVTELVIPKFSLDIGMFKLKLVATTIVVKKDSSPEIYTNFASCVFQVERLPLIAVIKGGTSRNVYFKDNITLDGSKSSDPNQPITNQNHLTYTWNCDKPYKYCKSVTSKESQHNLPGPFPKGQLYNFTLSVNAVRVDSVSAYQLISIVGEQIVGIDIICVQNCGNENSKVNSKEIVYLKVESNTTRSEDLEYSWTYAENSQPEESVDPIKEIGTPSNILIIKANSLTEGSTYHFNVQVVGSLSRSSITVVTDKSPDKGNCTISPKTGIAATTLFTIICQGFDNSSDITGLKYEFFEASSGVLLGFNYFGEIRDTVLSQNNIIVRISNSLGLHTEKNITVEVSPLESTNENIQNLLNKVNKLSQYGDAAGTVRSISVISDVIMEMENKTDIIKKLLDILDQKQINDFSEIKMYSLILKKLVSQGNHGQPNGLDHYSCKVTGNLMKKMSKKVLGEIFNKYNASTEITAKELEQVTRVFLETADALLISRDPVMSNKSAGTIAIFNAYVNYKNTASAIMSSIENFSKSIGHQLLPSQPEVIIQSNKSTIWIKFDTPERLSKLPRIPLSSNKSYVKISDKLAKALKEYALNVRVEFAVLHENPYWWDYNERNLESEIVSMRMFKQITPNAERRVFKLPKEVDIFLKLKKMKNQIISGSVTMPTLVATDDEKDSAVSVHKLDAPERGGSGKIVFKFLNLKPNEALKVLVLENMRPDYDFVNTKGFIVDNAAPAYVTFFTNESPDVFLYIGLLPTSNVLPGVTIAYTFEMYSLQCQTRSGGEWNSKICKVGNLTTNDTIHCECIHLSFFGGSILIAPNKLDPIKDIRLFLTVPDNPVVFIIVLTLLLFYVITLTWAYRKDKRDKLQKIVIVLEDNYPGEKWGYLITVFTGARLYASTTANVGFEIFGKLANSRAHVFRSKERKVLQKGSDDWFIIFTPKHLGELQTLHIWHDNSGPYPDWYCVKIVVQDLTFGKEYSFLVERWFCIGKYSKYVEAMLKPSLPKEITRWNRLFSINAFYYFRESHLWMSIFFCHPRTCIPRTHRVSIATSLIMCSLLTSIMFYEVGTDDGVDIASYSIRFSDVIIAIESAVINTPITFLIVFLFRKSREVEEIKKQPDKEQLSEKESKNKDIVEINQNVTYTDLKPKEKGPLRERMFRFLSEYVHNTVNPEPFIPVQVSDVPTTAVIERPKFAIIAWILCQACIWVSAFFIMLYGLKLGKVTSELWITATLMGIGQGIFISTPIKLFIFSFVLALAFQQSHNVTTFDINMIDTMRLDDVGNKEFLINLIEVRSRPEYHPLSRLTLLDMHKRKIPTNLVWGPMIKLFIMSIFTLTGLMVGGYRWTAQYYSNNIHIEKMLSQPMEPGAVGFEAALNISRFAEYLLSTVIPAVHTEEWYNRKFFTPTDDEDVSREWTQDANTRLLSIPRLRQIRVKPASCNIPDIMKVMNIECNGALSDSTEDTMDYDPKWKQRFNISKSPEWIYHPRTMNQRFYGLSGRSYHDGGYIAKFGLNHKETNIIVTQLIDNRWFDHLTRVIFLELTLYNINTKVISIATITAEYLPSGVFFPTIEVESLPDSLRLETEVWFVLLGIFEVLFILEIIFKISESGLIRFVISFWNILELCIVFLSLICLIFHIIQILAIPQLLQMLQKRGQDEHLDISSIDFYIQTINFILFILFFLSIVWVLKYSMLGYKIKTFYYTLKLSFHLLKWLILVLLLFFVCVGSSLSSIFNSPIYTGINFKFLILYRMSYSGISSENNVLQQKNMKILYCFTCAAGYVFFLIIITYYYRLGKYYKYGSKYLNIRSSIIKHKIKSLKLRRVHKDIRLSGGSDELDDEQNCSIFCEPKQNLPLDLHEVRLKLMSINVSNFLINQNKLTLVRSNPKHRMIGNVLYKDKDLFHKELLNHNFISADTKNSKVPEKLPYYNLNSQDNSYYFDRIISKLDCIIDRLDDICDSEFEQIE